MMIDQPNKTETHSDSSTNDVNSPQEETQDSTPISEPENENITNENITEENAEMKTDEPVMEEEVAKENPLESNAVSESTENNSEETSTSEEKENVEVKTESPEVKDQDSPKVEVAENLEETINHLQKDLEKQNAENSNLKAQYMRIAADFENYRRRSEKEKNDLAQQVKKKTISELLPVVDNFERARTQIKPANDGEMAIHKSYQGVYKNLVDSLKKIGVSAMRPEEQPFDPNYHEAMFREPTNKYPEGVVLEQLVRGYLLNDEVLRHAMVKVSAPPEEEEITQENQNEETNTNIEGEEIN